MVGVGTAAGAGTDTGGTVAGAGTDTGGKHQALEKWTKSSFPPFFYSLIHFGPLDSTIGSIQFVRV